MIEIPTSILTIIGVLVASGGTMFSIFFYFQKPQLALERRVAKLEDNDKEQDKTIILIKTDHTKSSEEMQKEMKELTMAVNELSKTVVRLSTIIDERIPRASSTMSASVQ